MTSKKRTDWIMHLVVRLVAIPLLFVAIYRIVLLDKTDPMGLGALYAFITTSWLCLLFFGIESVVLYRKKRKAKFYINLVLTAIACLGALTIVMFL